MLSCKLNLSAVFLFTSLVVCLVAAGTRVNALAVDSFFDAPAGGPPALTAR